ncbi:MAG: beta-ketoacyl synthase N-terminal-like domain-containing protein [Bacteriovoracaceae bacterium]
MDISYSKDDCVIVSRGCLLPDALNPSLFWENIAKNHLSIKPLSKKRWEAKNNFSPYRELEDKTYSHWGAEIAEEVYQQLKKKFDLKNSSRLEVMAHEALQQAIEGITLPSQREKVGIILGAMNPDENYYITRFKCLLDDVIEKLKKLYSASEFIKVEEHLKKHCELLFKDIDKNLDDILPSSIIHKLKERHQIKGTSFIVDAACASGIASIDCAISLIRTKVLDMAFVGGMESNLGQGSYVLFSKVGALCVENCIPFDKKSDGLSQGEGAVVFCIQRYEDAIRDGHKIYGVIRGIGSSSDGRSASLFQPNHLGQLLAEERAYSKLDSRRVDYLELHGTGTKIGDHTEAQTTEVFFKGFRTPVGSVKSLVGHTKATAGATGILKCLLALENHTIPRTSYIHEPIFSPDSDIYINSKELKISPDTEQVRFGISSFGFGGTNFHVVLENHLSAKRDTPEKVTAQNPVLLGTHTIELNEFDPQWFTGKNVFYKIPPKSIKYIDPIQLLAVKATEILLNEKLNLKLTDEQRDSTQVISASSLGMDILDHLVARISLDTIAETLKSEENNEGLVKNILDIKQGFGPISEESGPGILNNVIAGRVCNAFNFRGRNFNIDSDQASIAAALKLIISDIKLGLCELVFLIGVEEEIDQKDYRVIRKSVTSYAISSLSFAQKNFLKIQAQLEDQNATP